MPATISSSSNRWVKWVKRLQSSAKARRQEGVFVLEGSRLATEAVQAEGVFVLEGSRLATEAVQAELPLRLVLHDGSPSASQLAAYAQLGAEVFSTTPSVLKACAATQSPPGLLMVAEVPQLPAPEQLTLGLLIDRLSNPGNLGAILRTAAAVGVQTTFLTQGTVDAYNPKVVRGAMGAHFRMPLQRIPHGTLLEQLDGVPLVLADAHHGVPHTEMDWLSPVVLAVAGETDPPSAEVLSCVNQRVRVIYPGRTESLNAAVAVSIILFEILRQRGGR